MIRSKLKKSIIISFIIVLIILGTQVNAETGNTFTAQVTPTQSTIKPEEEITAVISVSNIDMGEDGINTLEGMIQYDTEIFEEIKDSNIESYNNWSTTYNDESSNLNGKFLAVNLNTGIKEDTKILGIKIKAKKDIKKTKQTTIKIKDVTSNNGTDLVNVGDLKVKVRIEVEGQIKDEIVNNTTENTTQNTTENTSKNTTKVDNTYADKILPRAGINSIIAILIIGIGVIAIGTGVWIYKTKKK